MSHKSADKNIDHFLKDEEFRKGYDEYIDIMSELQLTAPWAKEIFTGGSKLRARALSTLLADVIPKLEDMKDLLHGIDERKNVYLVGHQNLKHFGKWDDSAFSYPGSKVYRVTSGFISHLHVMLSYLDDLLIPVEPVIGWLPPKKTLVAPPYFRAHVAGRALDVKVIGNVISHTDLCHIINQFAKENNIRVRANVDTYYVHLEFGLPTKRRARISPTEHSCCGMKYLSYIANPNRNPLIEHFGLPTHT